jgi:hypothetical protein
MNAMPLSHGSPWAIIFRAFRLVVYAFLFAPLVILGTLLGEKLLHVDSFPAFALIAISLMVLPFICFSVLRMLLWRPTRNVTYLASPIPPHLRFARALVAGLLVAPWAMISFGLFLKLPPFHSYGAFAVQFLIALFLAVISIYGICLMVWPPTRVIRGSRPGFPPDPPSGGAPVLAPLKPPPPILVLSAAKELPREDLPATGES